MKITIETPSILDIRPGVRLSIQPNGVILIEPEPPQELPKLTSPNVISSFTEEYTVPTDKSSSTPRPTRRPNLQSWAGAPTKKQKQPPEPELEPEPVQVFPYTRPRNPESEALERKILTDLKLQPDIYQWYSFSELLDTIFPDVIRRKDGTSTKEYNAISTAVKRLASVNELDVQKLNDTLSRGRGVYAQYRLHKED
jgi:hypothetical protein